MIDWLTVVAHGFWIAGLALILAALSYYYWLAGQEGRSLRRELAGPSFQKLLLVGLLLVGIGTFAVTVACVQHWKYVKSLSPAQPRSPLDLALVVGILIGLLGLLIFASMVYTAGPFG